MSWTDPSAHVYTTGEVVTAGTLNTYVQANLLLALHGTVNNQFVQSATFTITFSAAATATGTATFGTAFATGPATITVSCTAFTNNTPCTVHVTGQTTSNFTWFAKNVAGTNLTGSITGTYIACGT